MQIVHVVRWEHQRVSAEHPRAWMESTEFSEKLLARALLLFEQSKWSFYSKYRIQNNHDGKVTKVIK